MQRCTHSLSTASALRSIFFPTSQQTCVSTIFVPSYATDYLYTYNPSRQQHQQQQQVRYRSDAPQRDTGFATQKWSVNSRRQSGASRDKPPQAVAAELRKFGAQSNRRPKDEEIASPYVRISGGSGKAMGEVQSLESVLQGLDRSKEFLVQVSPVFVQREEAPDAAPEIPVCRIMGRKEYFEWEQGKQKKAGGAGNTTGSKQAKQLELSWQIEKGDLQHRLDKAEAFLADGRKVEILLAPKKRGKPVGAEDAQALVKTIRTKLLQDTKVKEGKSMEGQIGAMATLFFERKS